jgi:tRNA-specific 2-thiouridylase
MAKTVALFSGGLDSTLAILTVLRQDIEIKALKFLTPFDHELFEGISHSSYLFSVAENFGFEVKLIDLSEKFIEILKDPKFGYGKNMNPCIDCRILMLKEAKIFMDTIGADFIITGEVLGQRPKSQRKEVLYLIDKEAEVKDYVLRPLSAKLLKVTIPEAKGTVNRDMLYDFRGRSRKPQMALGREFGLTDYPAPAGGCLLTEPNYAHRLKDLLAYTSSPNLEDLKLLRIGRHFRFSPSCKIIVGRNKAENEKMLSIPVKGVFLKVEGCGSPITLILGDITGEAIRVAASLCARYSDAKNLPEVEVSVTKNRNALCEKSNEIEDYTFRIIVSPANINLIEQYMIERNKEFVERNP